MIDLKLLREEPERVRKAVARKKFAVDFDAIFAADAKRRAAVAEAESARAGQKNANNDMAKMPKGSPEFIAKVAEMEAALRQGAKGTR